MLHRKLINEKGSISTNVFGAYISLLFPLVWVESHAINIASDPQGGQVLRPVALRHSQCCSGRDMCEHLSNRSRRGDRRDQRRGSRQNRSLGLSAACPARAGCLRAQRHYPLPRGRRHLGHGRALALAISISNSYPERVLADEEPQRTS